MKPLTQYIREIVRHNEDFPGHGVDCVCMDNIIRAMRADIRFGHPTHSKQVQTDQERKAESRINHVLRRLIT